jgi:hypothetical protein
LLLLGSLLLPAGNAITFNSLIDDGKLAVTLNYPSEVKRGTCFNVRLEVNALTAMSDLNVTLVIELRSGPSVNVLFTGKVVNDWSGGPGPVTNSIVGACVTSSHPTGVIVLRTSIEYNIGSDRLTLVSSFLMGLARDTTYDELAALYSAAQNEISRLRSAVDDLRREQLIPHGPCEGHHVRRAGCTLLGCPERDLEAEVCGRRPEEGGGEAQGKDLGVDVGGIGAEREARRSEGEV